MLYEKTSKAWKWWIEQQCPSGYKWVSKTKTKWVPKTKNENVKKRVTFAIDNVSKITNVLKLTNSLGSNLSSIPSSSNSLSDCSAHPIHYLQGNDLLTDNHGSVLYTISLQETTSSTPICFMAKASPTQAWSWYQRLSHLNFDYINLLSKKDVVIGLPKLKYVKDQLCSSCEDLCGPMRVASINEKKYILVIVDDYSIYTWTLFLRSKDETPEVLKDFLKMIQRNLQASVIYVRTDKGIELLNKTLHAFFKEKGIEHQTSTPRTPELNGVVKR
ncbi:retrovirus-related pol polyprotein from transposon TNT 1-94 [Tanacetum coccineum]